MPPLLCAPPPPVCNVIAKHLPGPGRDRNVNPYDCGNPDIRNGLGHFNLDVIDDRAARIYVITDRYEFPELDDHRKPVRHGEATSPASQHAGRDDGSQRRARALLTNPPQRAHAARLRWRGALT